jgi:hypothetical protein
MEYTVRGSFRLERGGFVRIEDGAGTRVDVQSGAVWITEEGDQRDYFIAAGGQFTVASERVTLVSAIGGSNLRLAAPPKRGLLARLADLWAELFMPGSRPTSAAL